MIRCYKCKKEINDVLVFQKNNKNICEKCMNEELSNCIITTLCEKEDNWCGREKRGCKRMFS